MWTDKPVLWKIVRWGNHWSTVLRCRSHQTHLPIAGPKHHVRVTESHAADISRLTTATTCPLSILPMKVESPYAIGRYSSLSRISRSFGDCAIIGSWLDCCNSMFYKMSDTNFNNLQRIQNRAARIVCGVGRRQQNARQICRNLHWLPVYSRADFKLATLCFKSHVMHNRIIWQ